MKLMQRLLRYKSGMSHRAYSWPAAGTHHLSPCVGHMVPCTDVVTLAVSVLACGHTPADPPAQQLHQLAAPLRYLAQESMTAATCSSMLAEPALKLSAAVRPTPDHAGTCQLPPAA